MYIKSFFFYHPKSKFSVGKKGKQIKRISPLISLPLSNQLHFITYYDIFRPFFIIILHITFDSLKSYFLLIIVYSVLTLFTFFLCFVYSVVVLYYKSRHKYARPVTINYTRKRRLLWLQTTTTNTTKILKNPSYPSTKTAKPRPSSAKNTASPNPSSVNGSDSTPRLKWMTAMSSPPNR